MGGLQAIQLNSCKNFKNRLQRIVNRRQIKFLKDEVIGHIVMDILRMTSD
jgi:hypothetical protein